MKSLKSLFSFLFICFIFNIGKSQSIEKTQIDNVIFEQFLKDSKKDKKIDNYCEQKVLDEITALEINLESCDINGDTYLKISFELNFEHDVPKKYYVFKKTLFEKKTIKSRDCYFDKFFVQVDYESFLNFNWDFTSNMKNLAYFGFFNRSDISSFPAFNKNPINLSNLNNLKNIRIKDKVLIGMPSTINGGVNILVGHNNALKYIEAPYGLFSQLINSSELSDLDDVTICSQIDTIVNIKRLNSIKILKIPYSVTNEEYKIRSMALGGSHSILNFTKSINRLSLGSNKKLEDQFEINLNDSIKIEFCQFDFLQDNDDKTTLNLKFDVSKHAKIVEIEGLAKPFYRGSKLLNGVHVPNLVVPFKLILYQTRNQSFYYENNPYLNSAKTYGDDPSIPQHTWIEFHNVKTKAEIEADSIAKIQLDEQIKIQKEIKRKEEEFNNSLLSKKHDSKIKTIFDKIINEVLEKKLVQKDISQLILTQHEKLGESIGHKLTEDESKYFYKLIGEYTKEYQKQIELYNLLYSNKNSINSQGSTNQQQQQQQQAQSGPKYCQRCNGSGNVDCYTCGGRGQIECKACYGKGYCSTCPDQRCVRCGITGRQSCDRLSMGLCKGKKDCENCFGTGKVD
jgi:hypothetical protein